MDGWSGVSEKEKIRRLKERYFKKVTAFPEGAIVHHGVCYSYEIGVCTCGLLHDLDALEEEDIKLLFPRFREQMSKHLDAIDVLKRDAEKDDGYRTSYFS